MGREDRDHPSHGVERRIDKQVEIRRRDAEEKRKKETREMRENFKKAEEAGLITNRDCKVEYEACVKSAEERNFFDKLCGPSDEMKKHSCKVKETLCNNDRSKEALCKHDPSFVESKSSKNDRDDDSGGNSGGSGGGSRGGNSGGGSGGGNSGGGGKDKDCNIQKVVDLPIPAMSFFGYGRHNYQEIVQHVGNSSTNGFNPVQNFGSTLSQMSQTCMDLLGSATHSHNSSAEFDLI